MRAMRIEKVFFSGDVTAHLGLIRVVMRQVLRDERISVGEVRNRLMIEGLARNAPALGSSIAVASKVGFFEVSGSLGDTTTEISMGRYEPADPSPPSVAVAFIDSLMAYSMDSAEAPEPMVPDLTCALVWLLAQDPRRPFVSWGATDGADPEAAIKDAGLTEVVQNDTQWNSFRRWAHQLGLGTLALRGRTILLTADPTLSLDRSIDAIAATDSVISGRQFGAELAKAIPVVSGGAVNDLVRAALPKITRPDSDLSLSETHALFRLQAMGRLKLDNPDDASPERRLSLGRIAGRPSVVSSVEVFRRG